MYGGSGTCPRARTAAFDRLSGRVQSPTSSSPSSSARPRKRARKVTDLDVLAELQRLRGLPQRSPDADFSRGLAHLDLELARAELAHEEDLDLAARAALLAEEAGGDDAGVVDHDEGALGDELRQVRDGAHLCDLSAQVEQTRGLALVHGALGDELGGEVVLEGVDAHPWAGAIAQRGAGARADSRGPLLA